MSVRVFYDILNQKGTPAMYTDTFANRPAFGFAGRLFISTDSGQIFEDTGTAWTLVADAGVGGGTLSSVCLNGNTTASGIVITAGGLSSNSITNTGNTAGSVLFAGTSGLESQSNATFFWDNTNKRLGIGNASPGAPLDIHGTGTQIQLNGTGTNNSYLQFQNAGVSKWRIGNTYNAGANTLDIYNNGLTQTALSFNASTNVGTFATSIIVNNGAISSYGLQVNNSLGNPGFVAYQNSDSSYSLQVATTGATTINLNANGSTSYINTIGKFGLGISNPATKLDVYGSGTANSIMTEPVATFYKSNGIQIGSDGTNGLIGAANSGTSLILLSRLSGNYAQALTINSTGNILIGTTTTTIDSSNFGLVFQQDGSIATSRNVNGGSGVANFYGNAGRFLIYGNGTAQNTTGTYGILSDLRLKNNINNATNKLEDLLKVRIVNYNLLEYPGEKLLGVIAQELEQIFPNLVDTNDDGYKGVKMSIFIPIIIKSIQELNEKLVKNNIN
jgi:hypothetical protein